jgi:hypothetical protein
MRARGTSPTQRAEMGRRGKERYESFFRVDRYVGEFRRLYEELLSQSPRLAGRRG